MFGACVNNKIKNVDNNVDKVLPRLVKENNTDFLGLQALAQAQAQEAVENISLADKALLNTICHYWQPLH